MSVLVQALLLVGHLLDPPNHLELAQLRLLESEAALEWFGLQLTASYPALD